MFEKARTNTEPWFFFFFNLQEIQAANGFVLVFDFKNRDSFESLSRLRAFIVRQRAPLQEKRVPIVLIGNFADVQPEQRMVSSEEAKLLSVDFECAYFETGKRTNMINFFF